MTGKKKPSKDGESANKHQQDRHNQNAKAAAALEPVAPRIDTDHI
ncbi:hypothetical protein [Rossellomorea aquimaris]|nr:hypothetical protein [Rossellomorea aquimaris]